MPRIDLSAIDAVTGSDYPSPHDAPVAPRRVRPLSPVAGLRDFNANHVELPEGVWSSQRHWHEGEDEFAVMVSGTATLVDDAGETVVGPGDCLAFPKGDGNGHHLIGGPGGCVFVVVGVAEHTPCHYPDIDMVWDTAAGCYVHEDGTAY